MDLKIKQFLSGFFRNKIKLCGHFKSLRIFFRDYLDFLGQGLYLGVFGFQNEDCRF